MNQESHSGLKTGYTRGNIHEKSKSTKIKPQLGERSPRSPDGDSHQERSLSNGEEDNSTSVDDHSDNGKISRSDFGQSDRSGQDDKDGDNDVSSETSEVQQTMTLSGQESGDQEISSRQARIIREILTNFDLEKVMDRYRGESVYKSCSRSKFRLRLDDIMGNEKIPFNDRKWNDSFRQKVLEDLEKKQDERERRLAEAETQRVLKLKLQGVIRDDGKENGRKERERQSAAERKFERRKAKKHESLFKPNDIETQMEILHRDESEVKRRDRQDVRQADQENEHERSDSGEGSGDVPTYRSHLGRIKVEKSVDVHPDVQKLYTEEDLEQLYREAENLVRRTTTIRTNKK